MFIDIASITPGEQANKGISGTLKKFIQVYRKLNFNKEAQSYLNQASIDLELIEDMEIGVYLYDHADNSYLYVNRWLSRLTGIPRGEIKESGVSILQRLVHHEDLPKVLDISRKTFEQLLKLDEEEREGCSFKLYYRIKRADGTFGWVIQQNKFISTGKGTSPVDMGYIISLPEQQTTPRIAGYLTTKIRSWELLPESSDGRLSLLSRRELEVLRWVATGISSQSIAQKLDVSIQTVKIHRKNILRKLQVKTSLLAIRILESEDRREAV